VILYLSRFTQAVYEVTTPQPPVIPLNPPYQTLPLPPFIKGDG
jgi:hypothetical protein